jgi:poly-gamma-glutamate capsule biosynthesis protein CapA/YwtB (metallophosphatase superfamily)
MHYRMHPDNTPVLEAAGIDCCALANNHMLDWGYDGLEETLQSLHQAGIAIAGAGEDRARAMAPAVIDAATGEIKAMRMPIFRSHKFRLSRAGEDDASWLAEVLDRESRRLGATRVEAAAGELLLRWG